MNVLKPRTTLFFHMLQFDFCLSFEWHNNHNILICSHKNKNPVSRPVLTAILKLVKNQSWLSSITYFTFHGNFYFVWLKFGFFKRPTDRWCKIAQYQTFRSIPRFCIDLLRYRHNITIWFCTYYIKRKVRYRAILYCLSVGGLWPVYTMYHIVCQIV